MNPSEMENADLILAEFDEIADSLGIKHFLWHGTCLGIVRDGIYPETDPDIDVGIICSKEERELLFQTLTDYAYTKQRVLSFFRNCHFNKYGLTLDIYFWFPYKYLPFLEELDTIDYNGKQYNIPSNIEDLFSDMFGEDWRERQQWIHVNGWLK